MSNLKTQARGKVATAIASGRLVRPEVCERCDASGPVEGHHADYSAPLDVEWLCHACHRGVHGQHTPKGETHQILVRLPVSQHRVLKQKADSEKRSVNSEVLLALEEWLKPKEVPSSTPSEGAAAA